MVLVFILLLQKLGLLPRVLSFSRELPLDTNTYIGTTKYTVGTVHFVVVEYTVMSLQQWISVLFEGSSDSDGA